MMDLNHASADEILTSMNEIYKEIKNRPSIEIKEWFFLEPVRHFRRVKRGPGKGLVLVTFMTRKTSWTY